MAKYAPTYMSCYDGPEYTLAALTLSANEFVTLSATGTAIGNIVGRADATDSVLSIVETDDNFQLDGVGLEVGPNGDTLVADTYEVTIRETNPWASPQYRDTVLEVVVTAE